MARKHLVTRTVKALNCDVLVCDLSTKEVKNIPVILPRVYPTDKDTIKAIEKSLPDGIKFLAITSSEVKETLYGMDETDFIKAAHVLPPRSANDNTTDAD